MKTKTIALILTAAALASCSSDSGHHHSYHPVPGRTEPPRVLDPEPIRPRPDGGFGGIFFGGGHHRDIGALTPGGRRGLRPDVFGRGRDDAPEVMPSDPPRLGEPPRAPSSRFLRPDLARTIPVPSATLPRPPAHRFEPPATIIPRLPSPRPTETTGARIAPGRISPGTIPTGISPSLRLDPARVSR